MNLLELVAVNYKSDPAFVFFCAYDFHEIRLHRKNIAQIYFVCVEDNIFADFVNDFCLDVLNGVIVLPTMKVKNDKGKKV
jgi:hypothetical protein